MKLIMKRYLKRYRSIAAMLCMTVMLSSMNGYSSAVSVNAAESNGSMTDYLSADISLDGTRQSTLQVQKLAAALYDKNIEYFSSRNGGFSWDTEKKKRSWTYYNGIMMDAYLMMDDCFASDVSYYKAVNSFYDANISYIDKVAAVDTTGNSSNYYRETELDSIPPVRALFDLLKSDVPTEAEREKYTQLIMYVYDLMTVEYPTVEGTDGNFKHKYGSSNSGWSTYPVALDGLYMAQPFFMELANAIEDGTIDVTETGITADGLYSDVVARMCWIGENLYDEKTGLYNHGWGPSAGVNGQFWLRAVGWYAAALADVIGMLPERFDTERNKLIAIEKQLFDGMLRYQDPENGMWNNVIDHDLTLKGSKVSNLPETSGSALMAYAMLRSYSEGHIEQTYCEAGLRAFNGIVRERLDSEGLQGIYISSGVGTTAESYLTKNYQVNEAKGVAPLMMAACYANKAAERCYGTAHCLQGDVNGDGKLNISDVILLQKWLISPSDTYLADSKAADLNNDGMLNDNDLDLMKTVLSEQY